MTRLEKVREGQRKKVREGLGRSDEVWRRLGEGQEKVREGVEKEVRGRRFEKEGWRKKVGEG